MKKPAPLDIITSHLQAAHHILLLTHQDPDPDAIGSTMAMKLVLEAKGKRVFVPYCISAPKAILPVMKGIQVYDKRLQTEIPAIDLSAYDYALVLDSSYSNRHILGLSFNGTPQRGVGIIDHHTRTDEAIYPDQDYTQPDKSSVCEILFHYLDQNLLPFATQPERLRKRISTYLLHGMLDDMVGLLIPEKLSSDNLDLLFKLKEYVGVSAFNKILRATRTVRLPKQLIAYSKFLSHTSYTDATKHKYHLYALHVPPSHAPLFKKDYTNLLFMFEHYARTSCAGQGWDYGGFILTIDGFSSGATKVSARGSYMKQLFSPLLQEKGLFLSAGISGDSAVGGKIAKPISGNSSNLLKKKVKQIASRLTLNSKYEVSAYQALERRAEILIHG